MAFQKIPLDELSSALPTRINAFICSASFEERSTVVPKAIDPSRVGHAIICANKVTFTPLIDETATGLLKVFSGRASLAQISMENPLVIADQLQREVRKVPSEPNRTYVVDITSFTHEALLILLRVLQAAVKPSDSVICLYNGAADYSVGLPPDSKWLTKGVGEIRSVLGYPGDIVPTRKIHLIVLVGYEMERAERIIAQYEPSLLSLGYGSPLESISPPLHDLNKKFYSRLSDRYRGVSAFTFSCEDPLAARTSVEERVNAAPGFNVFIAPMNTKLSTVGVALAAFGNPAIQLCYATAKQYNLSSYSTPSTSCYIFNIPFSRPVDRALQFPVRDSS
jgi:hypothetical protein